MGLLIVRASYIKPELFAKHSVINIYIYVIIWNREAGRQKQSSASVYTVEQRESQNEHEKNNYLSTCKYKNFNERV